MIQRIKKMGTFVFIVITLPILLSLDSTAYNSHYYAKYQSPEGILFLSYTENWDTEKLRGLYHELLKNEHSSELSFLQEVSVQGDSPNNRIKGQFHALTNTITLYNGDIYMEPSDFTETLSHEYGHHFAYYHLKSHHFPFSAWANVRGLDSFPVQWNAFWSYSSNLHKWYPQEIMADDYVLLYGATKKVDVQDVFSNEAFYLRTQHENQQISNVLQNEQLHDYMEEATGLQVDENRVLKKPELSSFQKQSLSFSITKKADVAYRLNLSFYEQKEGNLVEEMSYYEQIVISSNATGNELVFSLNDYLRNITVSGYVKASVDVVDLNTAIGFQTSPFYVRVDDGQFTSIVTMKAATE